MKSLLRNSIRTIRKKKSPEITITPLLLDSMREVRDVLARIGVDRSYAQQLSRKFIFNAYLVSGVDNRAAGIIKQEMLGLGAEAAVSRDVSLFKQGYSSVLLGGTRKHFFDLAKKLALQPFNLKTLGLRIQTALQEKQTRVIDCRGHKLVCGADPLIMGILNVTPDSFHDGGIYYDAGRAFDRAQQMKEEGADIIDVGGESSRPGSDAVGEQEEKRRVLAVVSKIAACNIPVSIDTRRSSVAREALAAGACMVNDISALRTSSDMAQVVKKYRAAVVLMHMQGTPKNMQEEPFYDDVVHEVTCFLKKRATYARQQGIEPQRIIVDPGIGFGKTLEHNIALIRDIMSFEEVGYPVLIGASRKSVIAMQMKQYHDLCPGTKERLPGSIAIALEAFRRGVRFFRVHDVGATKQALRMTRAFVG